MEKESSMKRTIVCGSIFFAMLFILLMPVTSQAANLLSSISVQPLSLNSSKNEVTQIRWQQAEDGLIDVLICDLNGKIVKTFHNRATINRGSHEVSWDGRDDQGMVCPTGAYIPIIKIRTRKKGSDIYNPTASSWGLNLVSDETSYNPETQQISYRLNQPALCQMRVGDKDGGPAYKSIFGWEPRDKGDFQAAWNGKDVNGLKEVWRNEHFRAVLDAFSVPENSILLIGSNPRTYNYKALKKRFPIKPPTGSNIYVHAMHQRELCHDMTISASFKSAPKSKSKIPVISGLANLRVAAGKDVDFRQLDREKIEIYLFIDGKMLFEGPQPSLPATLLVDTTSIANGEHFLTVNVRTFEDHLGTWSTIVQVSN